MGLFENRRTSEVKGCLKTHLPIWFMRQAGRYHSHYQKIKQNRNFIEMCKDPEIAAQITLGPVLEFDLDAAILFSDILFPLDYMGLGLQYDDQRGPTFKKRIESVDDLKKCSNINNIKTNYFSFQGDALKIIKRTLSPDTTLIGFVGAPFTLYAYALEESLNKGRDLLEAKRGLYDGRYLHFNSLILPILEQNILTQIEAGADAIALFDTASGYLNFFDYKNFLVPPLVKLLSNIKNLKKDIKIIYYSKYTTEDQLQELVNSKFIDIDVLAVDFRFDLVNIFKRFNNNINNIKYIQGNIDPFWVLLDWPTLRSKIDELYDHLVSHNKHSNNIPFDRWIFGLGHGVLKETPEENIKRLVQYVQEKFSYC
ncbi:MAG: hypothetical protein HQK49_19805 [Oligoflexia bacterium]|nr:hypothetical protein [Oligoflexia bacterium]